MKKINLLKFLIIFLIPSLLIAQKTVTGNVKDNDGLVLPGASIVEKGTTNGVVTDFDGNYSITLKGKSQILVFSYIGFVTQEVNVADKTIVNIVFKTDAQQLDEVVVIGYGTSAKKDLTGSLSEVKEKSEIAAQYTSVSSLLQGRTSGLKVSSNTGSPGAAVSVRIRGSNSLRGNNEPLYVVDGVIIDSAGEDVVNATSDANETQQTQNGLTGINPRDIESMVVLKDASATAIYGSRGANGVILITTKKGKQGKAVINTFASASILQITKKINVLDPIEYAQYRNQTAVIDGNDVPYQIDGNNVFLIVNGIPETTPLRQINWQDEIYKEGYVNTGGINISGANDKSNYYMSASIEEYKGIVPNTFLNSGNLRLNYSNDLTDKLKLETRIGLYIGRGNMSQGASISGGSRSFTRQLISYNPLIGGELADDDPEIGSSNPFSWILGFEEKIKEKRLNASVKLTYKLTDDFQYQLRAGTNFRTKSRSRWYGPNTTKGSFTNGYLALSDLSKTAYTLDNLLIYKKRFNNKHKINATIGVTFDGSNGDNTIYEVGDFPINNLRERSPQLGSLVLTPFSSLAVEDKILSFLGRATYTFKNRYIFNASLRRDKSSKFRGNNKIGYFPAASFAWVATKEDFLKDSKVFNNVKVRASWGQVGNQAVKPFQTFNNFGAVFLSDANNSTVLGVAAVNIANEDLTWETTSQTNFGIDFGLFDNKITSNIDLYLKETTDLLINTPTPPSSGFSNLLVNQGSLENRGIEFSIDAVIKETDDFSFSLGGNISFNKSEITNLSTLAPSDIYIDGQLVNVSHFLGNKVSTGNNFKAPANAFIEGEAVGVFWGYQTNGIYADQAAADAGPTFQGNANQAGDVAFVDVNGDGNVNDIDKTIIGDPNPDFTYGLNANLRYKGFNLDLLFSGSYGNDILNGNLLVENIAIGSANNIRPNAFFDSFSNNPNGSAPRIGSTTASNVPNDRLIEDGTYFRLRNATISYDLDLNEKSFIDSFKIYASGNNLFTITNYSGYDPELTSFLYDGTILGVDWVGTPNVRSYVLGINIKF